MAEFRPRILIVDDIEANLFSLEDALDPLGVPTDRALSGAEALKAVAENDYSVVLLDVQMPVMDGFDTAKAIFQMEMRRHPPIIFVTAISKEEHYILKGYRAGCVDYLLKPLNLDLVRNKVRFCMDLHMRVLENEQLIRELQRSNEELQQFAYVASHDLQEPIRMVRNYMQLLAKRYHGQIDDKANKYIGYAIEGSERMQLLVDDLLELSRVSSHGKPPEPVHAGEALATAVNDLRLLIEESGAKIECADLPRVMADKNQLAQVFQNLISNGIKFRADRAPELRVDVTEAGSFYQFSVTDNGIGINEKYFAQIFIIFQRLHTREKYDGSGIGLAICKKIIERHGGRMWLESQEGKGSRFIFTLKKALGEEKNG